jgi:hypothetical protein
MICARCGAEASLVAEYQKLWCPACQEYTEPPPPPTSASTAAKAPTSDHVGQILLMAPVVGIVGGLVAWQGAGDWARYAGIVVATVLSAVVAAKEMSRRPATMEENPATIALGMLLLWVLVYPLYMFKRRKFPGATNYGVPALILCAAAIIFASGLAESWLARGSAAEETWVEVRCGGSDGTSYTCQVHHAEGDEKVRACWDVILTCANGDVGRGTGCEVVEPRQTVMHGIPLESFTGGDECDQVTGAKVENIRMTSEP